MRNLKEKIILHAYFYMLIKTVKRYNKIDNNDIAKASKISNNIISLIENRKISTIKRDTYIKLLNGLSKYEIAKNVYLIYKESESDTK